MSAAMLWLLRILMISVVTRVTVAELLMDAISAFVDVNGIASDAKAMLKLADEMKLNKTITRFDNTFPLSPQELGLLFQLYDKCGTSDSQALLTWCTGVSPNGTQLDGEQLCPPGVRTHPCTGRVLDVSKDTERVQYLWPWQGIKCDAFTDPTTITNIYLPGQGLRCRLQDLDFSYMVSLEQLDLSNNELVGPFPSWLGNMTMLRFLNLRENRITSNLPLSFGDNIAIEVIDLAHNQLTAPSLSFFKIFKRLRYLDLAGNRFNLTLPSGFFSGQYLEYLNLSYNVFHGPLPPLPTLKHLVSFDVSNNDFEGELPRNLGTWGRVDPNDPTEDPITEILDFSHNRFNGSIPPLLNQSSLLRFAVQFNRLSGVIPPLPRSLFSRRTPQYFLGNDFVCPVPQLTPIPESYGELTCDCKNDRRLLELKNKNGRRHKVLFGDRVPAAEATAECTACPLGTYANATTGHLCVQCPTGHIPNRTASIGANESAVECAACLPGTFANSTGCEHCTKCPPGAIAATSGQATCTKCFPGEFVSEEGSTECKPCPPGSFAYRRGSVMCEPCQPGTYTSYPGEFACLPCPRGHFQDRPGSVACRECPLGYVAPRPGHQQCHPCPIGLYFDLKSRSCAMCPPNTFTDQVAQTQCRPCANGTAAEGYGNTRCVRQARPGYGRRHLSNHHNANQSDVEEECQPGYFNNGSANVCQPCPFGTFASAPRAVRCAKCDLGTYSATTASSVCELAPVGTYVNELGAWRPQRCPPGHFADTAGSKTCRPCPEDTSSVFGGQAQCEPLVEGEVLQTVSWHQVNLSLIGVTLEDFQSNQALQNSLLEAWRLAQITHGITGIEPHIADMLVDGSSPLSGRVRVQLALETLLPPPRRKPRIAAGGLFASLREAYVNSTKTITKTKDSATEWFEQLTGKRPTTTDFIHLQHANVTEVIPTKAFQTSLTRQLIHTPLRAAASLLILHLLPNPFVATRAIRCPRGSFFTRDAPPHTRRCVPCPPGTFADTEGMPDKCKPCPVRHISATEGAEICDVCPWGYGAPPSATKCEKCAFFSKACGAFWNNVVLTVLVAIATCLTAWRRSRELWGGVRRDVSQLQSESAALLAAVRAFGSVQVRR